MTEHNLYAPPKAVVDDVRTSEHAPALWNPMAAVLWSLLFTPIFGAYLHMKNWQALGDAARAKQSKQWAMGVALVTVAMMVLGAVLPEVPGLDAAMRGGGIGLLVGWYYASGKAQHAHVLARFGGQYPRKGWAKPLLAAVALYALAVLVIVALAMVQGDFDAQ